MSGFAHVDGLPQRLIWDGVTVRAVHGEQTTLGLVELAPGAIVPEHAHAIEQAGILIQGSLSFRIGEESRELGPGETWCIPMGVPHAVSAGPEGAVLVEAFSPPRADWEALPSAPPGRGRWP